MKNSARVAW